MICQKCQKAMEFLPKSTLDRCLYPENTIQSSCEYTFYYCRKCHVLGMKKESVHEIITIQNEIPSIEW